MSSNETKDDVVINVDSTTQPKNEIKKRSKKTSINTDDDVIVNVETDKPVKSISRKTSTKLSKRAGLAERKKDLSGEETMEKWRKKSSKLAFIYDFVLDKYKKVNSASVLVAFLISTIMSLFSVGNFALSATSNETLVLVFKILTTTLSTIVALVTGIPKLFGWTNRISQYQKYLDSVEHFNAIILSEQYLPSELRKKPNEFIIQNSNKFLSVLDSAPNITQSEFQLGTIIYKKSRKGTSEVYDSSKKRSRQCLRQIAPEPIRTT